MNDLLIDVVTPSFNCAGYIGANLASIKANSAAVQSHIIFDAQSTDGTREILEAAALTDPKLKVFCEPDKGQSDAINKALIVSQADIIGWLNADDVYKPYAFQRVRAIFEAHPEIDVISGDLEIINEEGEVVGLSKGRPVLSPVDFFEDNPIHQPATFIRKRALDNVGLLDDSLHYCMDRELWLRIALAGYKFHYISECLAQFRLVPGTKTSENGPQFRLEWISVLAREAATKGRNTSPILKAIATTTSQYYFGLFNDGTLSLPTRLKHLCLACSYNPALLLNLGLYKILLLALLGRERNRYRRFMFHRQPPRS